MFNIIVGIILIVFSIFLIAAVLLQESKDKGLGGAISGGSSDTYFGKSKAQTRDKILSKLTMVVAILFTCIVIALFVGQNADKNIKSAFEEGIKNLNESAQTAEDTTADETTAVSGTDTSATETDKAEGSTAEDATDTAAEEGTTAE